jgi:hypothetical protein
MNRIHLLALVQIGLLVFLLWVSPHAIVSPLASAPSIIFVNPSDGGFFVPTYTWVSVKFSIDMDPNTIHNGTFFVNQATVPVAGSVSYIAASKLAVFRPLSPLAADAIYTATVTRGVRSQGGYVMASKKVWSFTTSNNPPSIGQGMYTYVGDLHSHSSYSDGVGTPADAFLSARANGLDFLGLTDHSHELDAVEWQDMQTQANAATVDGEFVGLRGFEYTGVTGHINVFETDGYVAYTDPAYDTLEEFYPWLASQPDAIGQFNHPAKTDIYNWNFNDFAYNAASAQKMYLREVDVYPPDQYLLSLVKGWHVGAVDNSDAHEGEWGIYQNMGVVASALTKEDILDALRSRRTYATPYRDFALVMQANGSWMGSVISNTETIRFTITAYDREPVDPILAIILYDNGVPVTVTTPLSTQVLYTWSPTIVGSPGHYYYAKAYFDFDGWAYTMPAYTSPIWTDTAALPPRWDVYLPMIVK